MGCEFQALAQVSASPGPINNHLGYTTHFRAHDKPTATQLWTPNRK